MKIQDIKPIINTDDKETKHNLEMSNNAKHSNIKLPWSSCLFTTLGQNTRRAYSTLCPRKTITLDNHSVAR